jgi:hypothetical protein
MHARSGSMFAFWHCACSGLASHGRDPLDNCTVEGGYSTSGAASSRIRHLAQGSGRLASLALESFKFANSPFIWTV